MRSRTGFIDADGAALWFEDAGEGRPLVLLHGFSLDARVWDLQFEPFAQHFRTIRYDLRGFGRSSVPVEGQAYSHEEDLAILLERLGAKGAILCGHSRGGAVAVDFVLRYPEIDCALVLVDSALSGYRWTDEASNLQRSVYRTAREFGAEAGRDLWLRDPLFARCLARPESAERLLRIISGYSGWHWLHRDPEVRHDPPALQCLEQLEMPVLVVVGEYDTPDMRGMASTLRTRIPGARSAVIAGSGHLPTLETPEELSKVVLEFLQTDAG